MKSYGILPYNLSVYRSTLKYSLINGKGDFFESSIEQSKTTTQPWTGHFCRLGRSVKQIIKVI